MNIFKPIAKRGSIRTTKRLPLTLLLGVLTLLAPFEAMSGDQSLLWSLYRDGENAFRQGNELLKTQPEEARQLFRKAALSFEGIVREGGIENGKLFYNLGNTYFRLGDLGKAVLNYRRAEKWMPHDENLLQNLDFARSRCTDSIEAKPQARLFQTLFFWHYDTGFFTRTLLFLVFFNGIWICAGIYLFRRAAGLRLAMAAFAVLSLLFAGSLAANTYQASRRPAGVILAEEVTARKGDSTTFEPAFKAPLHAGTEFTLLEKRAGWYHIELPDGQRCWIPESAGEAV